MSVLIKSRKKNGKIVLSVASFYVPEIGECEKCKYIDLCNDGEMCIVEKNYDIRFGNKNIRIDK